MVLLNLVRMYRVVVAGPALALLALAPSAGLPPRVTESLWTPGFAEARCLVTSKSFREG